MNNSAQLFIRNTVCSTDLQSLIGTFLESKMCKLGFSGLYIRAGSVLTETEKPTVFGDFQRTKTEIESTYSAP